MEGDAAVTAIDISATAGGLLLGEDEEEEQLLMIKIAQTQKMSRPILLIEPKNTPRD